MAMNIEKTFRRTSDLFQRVRFELKLLPYYKDNPHLFSLWDEEFGRLRVWASNVGLYLYSYPSLLEARLRDSSHIQDQTLQVLENLHESILEAKEILDEVALYLDRNASDSTIRDERLSDLHDIHGSLAMLINCLFQMSVLIQSPAKHDFMTVKLSDEVLATKPYIQRFLQDRFPRIDGDLLSRLVSALLHRCQFLADLKRCTPEKLSLEGLEMIARPIPMFDRKTAKALSTQTFAGSSTDEIVSHVTGILIFYVENLENRANPPIGKYEAALFQCPYCHVTVPTDIPKDWFGHFVGDLTPYLCLERECQNPHKLYSSSCDWVDHLRRAHLESRKSSSIDESPKAPPEKLTTCSLCGELLDNETRISHAIFHFKEIAVCMLPRVTALLSIRDEGNRISGRNAKICLSHNYRDEARHLRSDKNLGIDPSNERETSDTAYKIDSPGKKLSYSLTKDQDTKSEKPIELWTTDDDELLNIT